MNRGEIYHIELPIIKDGGHEQAGYRSGIIISTDSNSNVNPMCTVIPTTGSISALRFPFTVQIEPTLENGLTTVSIALVFQVRTLDKNRFKSRVGRLEKDYMAEIENLLKQMLGI